MLNFRNHRIHFSYKNDHPFLSLESLILIIKTDPSVIQTRLRKIDSIHYYQRHSKIFIDEVGIHQFFLPTTDPLTHNLLTSITLEFFPLLWKNPHITTNQPFVKEQLKKLRAKTIAFPIEPDFISSFVPTDPDYSFTSIDLESYYFSFLKTDSYRSTLVSNRKTLACAFSTEMLKIHPNFKIKRKTRHKITHYYGVKFMDQVT